MADTRDDDGLPKGAREARIPEEWARKIMHQALTEGRCAEVLECLFDGGSVTIDATTGLLALATSEQLAALMAMGDASNTGQENR